ncbi:MAG: hypothetical protein AAGA83_22795, partial [Cyanobacteria bacterium P01_F01_bin.116]
AVSMVATYTPQAEDTSIEADRYVFKLLAQRTNEQRMAMTVKFTQGGLALSLSGLKHGFSHLDQKAFADKVAQTWLGEHWPRDFKPKGDPTTWAQQDSIGLARRLHAICTDLKIVYCVIGGVASTTYGEPRLTINVDLMISVSGTDLYPLVAALEADGFYVAGVEDAVSGRMNTLQIIDQQTIERADLVIAGNEAWDAVKFNRRQLINNFYLASPEDVILNKLRWGKRSQSEKQWRDVLGVLKVQGQNLDFNYLKTWANSLELTSDLSRAMGEAGLA